MRFWWRVTRYDPANRDARGAYQGNAWTSIGDVGGHFDDGELTLERYLHVEDAYVGAVDAFAKESGAEHVLVLELERGAALREGQRLTIAEAQAVVRGMLREDVVCKLEAPQEQLTVHVGYDLYMYIGAALQCPNAIQRTRASGLYVEDGYRSPYDHVDG